MKRALLTLFVILNSLLLMGQTKLGEEWITGAGGQRIKFGVSGITTNNTVYYNSYFQMGNSDICDTNGNLLLASDGYNIYDSSAHYIDGGDTLIPKDFYLHEDGWSLYSQSSIFLPMDSGIYYFITPTFSNPRFSDCLANNHCFFDLLLYDIVDMNANSGLGKVVKRMQPLMQNAELSKTQMMACRHSNGKDWWLLKQGGDSNIVYKFLFTQDSIYDKGKQVFAEPMWGVWDLKGQSVFAKDGSQYASTNQSNSTGKVFVADFDRCYGTLSNPKIIVAPKASMHDPIDTTITDRLPVGLAYSPNGKLLYVICQYNIWQYDLQDTTWYNVAGLDTSFVQFQVYNASYLGLDDKIYIGNAGGTGKQMSVINNPDVKGIGCNFCPRCLRMDSLVNGYAGTPPCMPNYALGAQECWPEGTGDVSTQTEWNVYPNPAFGKVFIKGAYGMQKIMYNAIGQILFVTTKDEIDVSRLAKGLYFISCVNRTKKVLVE